MVVNIKPFCVGALRKKEHGHGSCIYFDEKARNKIQRRAVVPGDLLSLMLFLLGEMMVFRFLEDHEGFWFFEGESLFYCE